jgi:hypothetical protein
MCYILPGLFYLKFTANDGPKWTGMQIGAVILMCIGCFVMPTAVVFTFIDPGNTGCQVPWPGTVFNDTMPLPTLAPTPMPLWLAN